MSSHKAYAILFFFPFDYYFISPQRSLLHHAKIMSLTLCKGEVVIKIPGIVSYRKQPPFELGITTEHMSLLETGQKYVRNLLS